MMDITPFLEMMAEKDASDIFFTVGSPPCIKIEGVTTHLGEKNLSANSAQRLAYSLMSAEQIELFKETWEMDVALSLKSLGRFRINIFRQRGDISIVVRYISAKIKSIAELKLPEVLNNLVMETRGLVLIVGSTGSGKSTTLASMIDHRNRNKTGHILTIEDPIEYDHPHQQSIVNQREVGLDTHSYAAALKRAMREAPDVVMIGEIRDRESMHHAIAYADTGHLCLSTLHATNAAQTLKRIVNFFPQQDHQQILMDLSLSLKAVVSQRLVMGLDNKRIPATEIMINTPYIAGLIQKGEISKISEAISHSNNLSMQSFDQALYQLFIAGKISEEEALNNANSRNNLGLRIRLARNSRIAINDDLSFQ